jgi:hypothetical protein
VEDVDDDDDDDDVFVLLGLVLVGGFVVGGRVGSGSQLIFSTAVVATINGKYTLILRQT